MPCDCDIPCVECEGARNSLYNLLARIHGDGGHYTATHGIEKSVADADLLVAWYSENKKDLISEITTLRKALEKIAACRGYVPYGDIVRIAKKALLEGGK